MSSEPRPQPELPLPGAPPRDGIGEEDHPIPLWFNVGFYGLMVVGVVYLLHYAVFSGWSAAGQYAAEVAAAEERLAAVRSEQPAANPFRGDAAALAAGQEVFQQTCIACHQADGTGLVGPSLVDPYWKYGDDDRALFETVAKGRPGGMPPWEAVLGAERIWKALVYLETLPRSAAPGLGSPEHEAARAAAPAAGS